MVTSELTMIRCWDNTEFVAIQVIVSSAICPLALKVKYFRATFDFFRFSALSVHIYGRFTPEDCDRVKTSVPYAPRQFFETCNVSSPSNSFQVLTSNVFPYC